jgi:hypothetical protein
MNVRQKAALSLSAVAAVSIATKLWATSVTDNEGCVLKILQMAETSRARAESARSSNHVAYALGLCEGARILMGDSEIERVTGIHMQTYEQRLNSMLCQYAKSRREKRRKDMERDKGLVRTK